MIRCLIYWLFLKYVAKAEEGEDEHSFVNCYRRSQHRLAISKAELQKLQKLSAKAKAKRDTS
jgi:hypothetical protein